MALKDEPTLTDALDGLINAVGYAEEIDEMELSYKIAGLYQRLAQLSPEDDWENVEGKEFSEIIDDVYGKEEEDEWDMEAWDEVAEEKPSEVTSQGVWHRNPLDEE